MWVQLAGRRPQAQGQSGGLGQLWVVSVRIELNCGHPANGRGLVSGCKPSRLHTIALWCDWQSYLMQMEPASFWEKQVRV